MGKINGIISKVFTEQPPEAAPRHRELGKIIDVSISDIAPNPSQPRRHFPVDELTALAKSISKTGIIQPLTVRRTPSGFELVSGERRLRAAKLAGLLSVPCIVVKADRPRSAIMALVENVQRSDLNFFEEAQAISSLIEDHGFTREEAALKLGMAQSTMANKLRLLKLTDDERSMILAAGLTERHARALLRVQEEDKRKEILAKAAQGGWTVDATEKYIQRLEQEAAEKSAVRSRAVILRDVKLFFNSVNKALNVMRNAGVDANAKRIDHDDYIEYIIKIPSAKAGHSEAAGADS